MVITPSVIAAKFEDFNWTYFGGELPNPKYFVVNKRKSYLGNFEWHGLYNKGGWSRLSISTLYDLTEHEFECILIHEMVHCWQWWKGLNDHHGKYFKMKAAELNNITDNKYRIARFTPLSDATRATYVPKTSNTGKKKMYVGLYKKNGVDMFALIPTLKSAIEINRWMTIQYPKYEFNYKTIKKIPMLDDYTKSVKIVHGYPITPGIKAIIYN